jgi:DNA repair exonuclease SbcCD ATPase subunit
MNNKKILGAYPSSLIMQDFGEVDKGDEKSFHGYLLWDISDKNNLSLEQRPIQNNYSFQKLKINRFFDFEDIDMEIQFPTMYMKVSVVWNTFPALKTSENIDKVVKYLKQKYSGILTIKHENDFIVEDKLQVGEDSVNLLSINEKETQHKIISEFLTEKGYEEEIINEVLKIDDIISSRLELSKHTNIVYDIIKLNSKNVFSFDELEIDFRNLNGIIQVLGKNRGGKTTATIKSLMYVLFGKTIETQKIQKNGDSRFINNKLDVDSCSGSVVFMANGEYFGIKRETVIKWNKAKTEISSSPTTVKYYKLSSPDEELNDTNILSDENKNLTEDLRKKTQKRIDEIIGSYDDFIRIALTTSDNLNSLLSVVKSEFIDSLIKDAGFDICDLKLKEFKDYKKEYYQSKEKIVLNVELSENDIKQRNIEIDEIKVKIENIKDIQIFEVDNKIKTGNEYKNNLSLKLHNIDPIILKTDINDINNQINRLNTSIKQKNDDIIKLNEKISTLAKTYDVNEFNRCESEKEKHKQFVYDNKVQMNNVKLEIDKLTNKKFAIVGEIELIKRDGKRLKDEIASLKESQTCPTCGQLKGVEAIEKIKESINQKMIRINELVAEINQKTESIQTVESEIASKELNLKEIQSNIDSKGVEMEMLLNLIGELQNQKNQVEEREKLELKLTTIPIEIENYNLQIDALNTKIKQFDEVKTKIEENQKVQELISKSDIRLNELYNEKQSFNNQISSLNNQILNITNSITQLTEKIRKYKEQQRVETVFNEYEISMHRDGIPRTLLSKYAIPLINNELNECLIGMDFSVWLDKDDLSLKMCNNSKPNAIIDCIGGSGKERTFGAVALKYALNQINSKSKPSFLFFDEVMSKLVDESVDEFVSLLHTMKNKIKKIFIIEHAREVNPDSTIMVTKDENDISKIEY